MGKTLLKKYHCLIRNTGIFFLNYYHLQKSERSRIMYGNNQKAGELNFIFSHKGTWLRDPCLSMLMGKFYMRVCLTHFEEALNLPHRSLCSLL